MPASRGKSRQSLSGFPRRHAGKDPRRSKIGRASLRFNEHIEIAAALTPYAWEFRYPGDLAETYPAREEFDEALQHAQTIYDFVLNLIPTEARPDNPSA